MRDWFLAFGESKILKKWGLWATETWFLASGEKKIAKNFGFGHWVRAKCRKIGVFERQF